MGNKGKSLSTTPSDIKLNKDFSMTEKKSELTQQEMKSLIKKIIRRFTG